MNHEVAMANRLEVAPRSVRRIVVDVSGRPHDLGAEDRYRLEKRDATSVLRQRLSELLDHAQYNAMRLAGGEGQNAPGCWRRRLRWRERERTIWHQTPTRQLDPVPGTRSEQATLSNA